MFFALQAQLVLSISPHVQSKQAGQTTVSTCGRRREREETVRGLRETSRQSFYPLMAPSDSKVHYGVLSLKPGP